MREASVHGGEEKLIGESGTGAVHVVCTETDLPSDDPHQFVRIKVTTE